eukprot:3646285-Rhodomonas_salina.1
MAMPRDRAMAEACATLAARERAPSPGSRGGGPTRGPTPPRSPAGPARSLRSADVLKIREEDTGDTDRGVGRYGSVVGDKGRGIG